MKIILVISNEKGKNILFVLDNLRTLILEEAVKSIKNGEISDMQIIKTKKTTYIRSNPNSAIEDNLDYISISVNLIKKPRKEITSKALSKYLQKRKELLEDSEKAGEKVISIDGKRKKTEKEVIKYLSQYKNIIISAAKDLKVDRNLLGAILTDEHLRNDWLDDRFDWLGMLGLDTSVGIAQIKVSTAKDLIRRGFYNPNPQDKKISPENINKVPARYLYKYLDNPKYSVYFAAAKINQIKKDCSSKYDLRKLENIADLYSRKKLPPTEASSRGKQIAVEFYKIAKKVLKP